MSNKGLYLICYSLYISHCLTLFSLYLWILNLDQIKIHPPRKHKSPFTYTSEFKILMKSKPHPNEKKTEVLTLKSLWNPNSILLGKKITQLAIVLKFKSRWNANLIYIKKTKRSYFKSSWNSNPILLEKRNPSISYSSRF